MDAIQVSVADNGRADLRDAAATIWAEATAERDNVATAPLSQARRVIDAVLDSSQQALLLTAVEGDVVVGFAAISPDAHRCAEIRCLGVAPTKWGKGVGASLLAAVPAALAGRGFRCAVLSVYVDNERAVAAYRRAGWTESGAATTHAVTGRSEQRYRLSVTGP